MAPLNGFDKFDPDTEAGLTCPIELEASGGLTSRGASVPRVVEGFSETFLRYYWWPWSFGQPAGIVIHCVLTARPL